MEVQNIDSEIECLTPKTTITESKPIENKLKTSETKDSAKIKIRQQRNEINWARKSRSSLSEKEIKEKLDQMFQTTDEIDPNPKRIRLMPEKYRTRKTSLIKSVGDDVERFFSTNPPVSDDDSDTDRKKSKNKKLIIESQNQSKEKSNHNPNEILSISDDKVEAQNLPRKPNVQIQKKGRVKLFKINPNPNFNATPKIQISKVSSLRNTDSTDNTSPEISRSPEGKNASEASTSPAGQKPVDEIKMIQIYQEIKNSQLQSKDTDANTDANTNKEPDFEIVKEIISKSNYIIQPTVTESESDGQLIFPKLNDIKDHLKAKFVPLGDFLTEDFKFCDAELILGGNTFRAHKLVLSCQSKYFRELFKDKIDGIPFVLDNSIDARAFQLTLNFLYRGHFCETVFLNADSFYAFLYIADNYGIERLREYCLTSLKIMKKLEPQFALRLLELALIRSVASKSFLITIVNIVKPVYKDMKQLPNWSRFLSNPQHFYMFQKVAKNLLDS